METDLNKGHRKRLRERFLKSGLHGLHDYEAIELLLTYAVPRQDVKGIAKELVTKFNDISGVMDASFNDLCEAKGISENSSVLIMLIKELCAEYLAQHMKDRDVASSPEAVIEFSRMKLGGLNEEAVLVIYLNVKNHVLDYEVIIQGTVDQAVVYPRNIVKKALESDAVSIVIVHNHPSGICEPSTNDIRMTGIVKSAAEALNIKLLDHIIVGKSEYFSFTEENLL